MSGQVGRIVLPHWRGGAGRAPGGHCRARRGGRAGLLGAFRPSVTPLIRYSTILPGIYSQAVCSYYDIIAGIFRYARQVARCCGRFGHGTAAHRASAPGHRHIVFPSPLSGFSSAAYHFISLQSLRSLYRRCSIPPPGLRFATLSPGRRYTAGRPSHISDIQRIAALRFAGF